MKHEPFYISGAYGAPEIGVYAGWMANKDSFAAGQVFLNERHDIALVFSGECFVDAEMRGDLRQRGHEIKNNKDWLVHLYEEEGDQFFEKLNGLFSGILIDKRQRRAFLFNDRYSSERIYWCETESAFYFASEAKAILRVLPETRAFDEQGVAEFLTYGCTLEGRTLFRGIQVLPGASLCSFEAGKCRRRCYFSPANWESQPSLSAEAFQSAFEDTFKKILPHYFESEAKIGISLTGGLDTRMIMACRPETGRTPVCYTFSGETGRTMDDRLAHRVAQVSGLEHQLLRINADFFSDFATHVDRTVYITDGCLGVTGAHELYLNKQGRQLAPVRLTGNYGSEVLRGVSTFKPLGISPDLCHSRLARIRDSLNKLSMNGNDHPSTFAAFREIPWHLFGTLSAARSQVNVRTPYLDNEIVALAYQLPAGLRTSAIPAWRLVKANSPSLSRIPTDRRPSPETFGPVAAVRRLYCEATFKLDYLNNEGWPSWLSSVEPIFASVTSRLRIVGLHKYLHYRNWFRHELAEYLKRVVNDSQTQRCQFWNSDFFSQMANEHISGRKNYILEIDAALSLDAVERLLLKGFPSQQSDRAERGSSTLLAGTAK